jgi:hypothetical protein
VTWLVSYRAVSGEVVETGYDTREEARDALTDQLINSALVLWKIGESFSPTFGPTMKRRQEFFDRGDRFLHHVMRLNDSTEGEYVIVGKQGRQWLLCALPERAEVSR